jgi:hypothetical protein
MTTFDRKNWISKLFNIFVTAVTVTAIIKTLI